MNWKDKIMKDYYYGPSADLSYEELYHAFKKRFMEEVQATSREHFGRNFYLKRYHDLEDKE